MTYRRGLLPILVLIAVLAGGTAVRAAAEPIATAAIPPPAPTTPPVAAAQKPLFVSPMSSGATKKQTQAATHKRAEQAKQTALRKHTRQVKRERRQLYARAYPPPPIRPQYYPAASVPMPEADGPSMPPRGWYDRGPPFDYPYLGRRRMGPW